MKYKFLNIIDSLSDDEFKNFGKFLNSPFFNESKKITGLYEYIKKFYHSHNLDRVTPESISEHVYGEGKYENMKTRKLLSDFTFQLECFLVHNSVKREEVTKKILLAGEFRKKIPGKYLLSELRELKKNIFADSSDSINFYISKFRLADEELTTKKHIIHRDIQIRNIMELKKASLKLSLFTRLYLYHTLIQHNIQVEEFPEYGFDNLKSFLTKYEKNLKTAEKDDKGMYLLYQVLRLIIKRNLNTIFEEISKFIAENEGFLKKADVEFVMNTIVNFYMNEINRGRFENLSVFIEIFKKIDKNGYLDRIYEINHIIFVEIVHFAVLLKENELAEAIIWKYFPKINAFYKVDSLNLAIAILRYGQNRIGEVRSQLEKLKYNSYGFYLIAKSMLLKIYFEENSLKYIYPLVDSFKHYLKRNKTIPQYFVESFSTFLSYLTKLTSVKMGNMKDILRIEFNILNEKNFYGKEWLLEKAGIMNNEI